MKTKVGTEVPLQAKEWTPVPGYQGLTSIAEAPKLCGFAAMVL